MLTHPMVSYLAFRQNSSNLNFEMLMAYLERQRQILVGSIPNFQQTKSSSKLVRK